MSGRELDPDLGHPCAMTIPAGRPSSAATEAKWRRASVFVASHAP
jgi:hypothetical protein